MISGDTTYTDTLLQQSKDADVLVSDSMNKETVAQMEATLLKMAGLIMKRSFTIFRNITLT